MYKIKLKSSLATAMMVLLIAACTTKDVNGPSYSSAINLTGSSQAGDRTKTAMVFSTDDGATYSDAIVMGVGQKYKVKLLDGAVGTYLTNAYGFSLDWSGSNPKPDNATSDNPSFTMTGGNTLSVVVTGHFPIINSSINLKGSSQKNDSTQTSLVWSADGGATYSTTNIIPLGTPIKVKVWDAKLGAYLTTTNGFTFDWSGSTPTPSSAGSDNPTFVLAGDNTLSVVVTGALFCAPYDPTVFLGTWTGVEGAVHGTASGNFGGSNDIMTVTQDGVNPNKLWFTNLFGDGASITFYMILNPATSQATQTISVPAQSTSDPGTLAATTGTFDMCSKTFGPMSISYTAFGETFTWTYTFHR